MTETLTIRTQLGLKIVLTVDLGVRIDFTKDGRQHAFCNTSFDGVAICFLKDKKAMVAPEYIAAVKDFFDAEKISSAAKQARLLAEYQASDEARSDRMAARMSGKYSDH